MKLGEAIKHLEESLSDHGHDWGCEECKGEHEQLLEWLRELKDLREENKVLTSECDRLIKEKGELLSKVSGGDVLRICQLEEQLEKAKRLLKAAVDAIYELLDCGATCSGRYCDKYCVYSCETCPLNEAEGMTTCDEWRKWKHADEALALIGEEGGNDASN